MKKIVGIFLLLLSQWICAKQVGSLSGVSLQGKVFFPKESGNEMSGFSFFKNGVFLQDFATQCIFSSMFPVSGDIVLNGGTLVLEADFTMRNPIAMSSGKIDAQGYSVHFPQNISTFHIPSKFYDKGLSLLQQKSFSRKIYSLDWSYDGKYVAIGFDADNDIDELQIYELSNNTLTLKASYDSGSSNDTRVVRWHPSSYYLATGSTSGNELQTWLFDPNSPNITEVDNANTNDVIALAWSPNGNYLAIGKNKSSSMYVYPVANGVLGAPESASVGSNLTAYDVSWDATGTYIAIGFKSTSGADELQVFSFDGSSITADSSVSIASSVQAIRWHPTLALLAVGLDASSEQLTLYEHSVGSLTHVSLALVGQTEKVFGVAWSDDGRYVATAKDHDVSGLEVEVFYYNQTEKTLSFVSGYKLTTDANAIAWKDGNLAIGDVSGNCVVLSFESKGITFKDAKIVLNSTTVLQGSLQFEGSSRIKGDRNVFDLSSTGSIIIQSDATLVLQDMILKGANGSNIRAANDTGKLILCDVTWIQEPDSSYTFTSGSLDFRNRVRCIGANATFAYQSIQTSTVATDATLRLDSKFTFSYDPVNESKTLLEFEDSSAVLELHGGRLHATRGGMQLTKGSMLVSSDSSIASEVILKTDSRGRSAHSNEGIMFGDGENISNDHRCLIASGVELQLQQGTLRYNNLLMSSFIMQNEMSQLFIKEKAMLELLQLLTITTGKVICDNNAILHERVAKLHGSLRAKGFIKRVKN